MSAISLADLAGHSQWVAWRGEVRDGKTTKVPYFSPGRRAEANNPDTWLMHDAAVAVADTIVNGGGGGVGIQLGQCGEYWIAGIDYDACRDPDTGVIAPWAQTVIDILETYTEVSPSGTGAKSFFQIDPADVPELRTLMGTMHGRQFKRANGNAAHPPAIELYTSNRYFATTWQSLDNSPAKLRVIPLANLRWLIEVAGPEFTGKANGKGSDTSHDDGAGDDTASILARLNTAAKHNRLVEAALRGAATMRGGSRSEGAFGLGAALKRAGWSYQDMVAALLACPATREWAAENAADDRQFRRIWERGSDTGDHHGTDTSTDDGTIRCNRITHVGATKIPPRPWAYGNFMLFGSAAVLGAVDGGGKGAIAVVMALAMITGKPLLGERVWRKGPVVIVSYEDDVDEWHRRIAAACLHYELDCKTVLEDIHFLHKPGGRVSFASVEDGTVTFPDSAQIIRHLKNIDAVLLIIDPFNHAHELDDGNNNVMMAKVAGEVSRIVHEACGAGLVLHHLRKGSNGAPDDLMGATSLRATFRSARILQRMTADIAEKMKIADPWRYIRIAGSKENHAPPPEKASWFKLISVRLENATDEYPDGDNIGVATAWQPRPMFEGMDAATLRAVFQKLRQTVHSPVKQSKNMPWAGKALMDSGQRSEVEAANIITAWIESGVLTKGDHYSVDSKRSVQRLTLDDAKVAAILAELETASEPPGTG